MSITASQSAILWPRVEEPQQSRIPADMAVSAVLRARMQFWPFGSLRTSGNAAPSRPALSAGKFVEVPARFPLGPILDIAAIAAHPEHRLEIGARAPEVASLPVHHAAVDIGSDE